MSESTIRQIVLAAVDFPRSGSDSALGFLRKFGADLTGLLRLNCGSSS
jgi:hypothetical protein